MGAVPAARLEASLGAALRSGTDLAVIDTAPHSESAALAAARAADLAIVPLRPGLFATARLCAPVRCRAQPRAAARPNSGPRRGRRAGLRR